MAVFTTIEKSDLDAFLQNYDLDALDSYKGIKQGVENTNYHVYTKCGHYILTIFEKRVDPVDLPFFFGLTEHLSRHGIPCPAPIHMHDGGTIGMLCGKPAALVTYMKGETLSESTLTVRECGQIGSILARMHNAVQSFDMRRKNMESLPSLLPLFERARPRAHEIEEHLAGTIDEELSFLMDHWPKYLPAGVVHTDLFPDNALAEDGELTGIIDFYFSCNDYLAYDLAIVINAWCFNGAQELQENRLRALLQGYESVRKLEKAEKEKFRILSRAAAMRFLLTRLHDWLFHEPAHFVTPKDPREYLKILRFHQNENILDR